ncbi:MAG: imelysin family protein [Gemmobacter sp.]
MRSLALILWLVASPAPADVAEVVTGHIRPGYDRFAQATADLAGLDTCDAAALRPGFQAAFDAWMGVQHLRLGPVERDGRALAIAFWPDPKALGAKAQRGLMTGDPAALAPDRFAEQSVAARGLTGLERLLFPADAPPADPCPLIRATTRDLARMARDVAQEWAGYGDLLITAGRPGNTVYLSETEARQALFTQLATGLAFVADQRLGRPLGSFDKPRPERAEARAAGRSLRNVALALVAMRDMAAWLDADSPRTLAAFDRAIALAAALEDTDPALQGVADPQRRLRVEVLQQAVRAVRDAAIAEMAPALGVDLGFNAQDGD